MPRTNGKKIALPRPDGRRAHRAWAVLAAALVIALAALPAPARAQDEPPEAAASEAVEGPQGAAPGGSAERGESDAAASEPSAAAAEPAEPAAAGAAAGDPEPAAPAAPVGEEAPPPKEPAGEEGQEEPRAAAAPSLYVFELWHSGFEEEDAQELQRRFEEELERTGRFTLMDKTRGEPVLQGMEREERDCRSEECLVRLGRMLGAERVAHASVVNVTGNQWLLSGSLVDVAEEKTVREVRLEHQGSIFELRFEPIATMALALSGEETEAGVKEEGRPPPPPPTAKVEAEDEDEGGMPWWVWVLIGLGAAAVSGGGGGGGGGGGALAGGGGGGSTGGVTVTW